MLIHSWNLPLCCLLSVFQDDKSLAPPTVHYNTGLSVSWFTSALKCNKLQHTNSKYIWLQLHLVERNRHLISQLSIQEHAITSLWSAWGSFYLYYLQLSLIYIERMLLSLQIKAQPFTVDWNIEIYTNRIKDYNINHGWPI